MDNLSSTPTTVSYTVTGTATAGSDYTVLSGAVTIPALASSADIDVLVLDDTEIEGNETVVVTLSGVIAGDPQISITTVAANKTATVNIKDDEATTVSVTANDATASETPTDNGQFTAKLDNNKPAPAGGVVVSYVVSGTATGRTDYAALSSSVTIPGGATSATIDVSSITNDNAGSGSRG